MASAKIKNYRWIIVGLLFTGTVINYLDRQIIGLLKPTLEAEFSWTESDFGKIMSAFSFAYAIGLRVQAVQLVSLLSTSQRSDQTPPASFLHRPLVLLFFRPVDFSFLRLKHTLTQLFGSFLSPSNLLLL